MTSRVNLERREPGNDSPFSQIHASQTPPKVALSLSQNFERIVQFGRCRNDDVTIADDWGMDMFKIQRINEIHLMDKFWRSRSVEQISQPQSIKCNYVFSVLFMFSF